jgi:hypothetical protein
VKVRLVVSKSRQNTVESATATYQIVPAFSDDLTPVAGAAIECLHRSAILIVRLSVALRVRWRVRGVHVRWLPHMALRCVKNSLFRYSC